MTEKLDKLIADLDHAEEQMRESTSRMAEYIQPIVKAYTGVAYPPGEFHSAYKALGGVYVTYRATSGVDHECVVPLEVFEQADADAIEVARKMREAREEKKRAQQRAKDEAAYEALRVKLGKAA